MAAKMVANAWTSQGYEISTEERVTFRGCSQVYPG